MAKYLWVGSGASAYAGPSAATATHISSNIVDQYNFNKAGNWYYQAISNGQLRWLPTSATPGGGDTVVFGGEYFGAVPGLSQAEVTGWTAARSPCLFGGFSGGVGSGSWSNTSGSASGTTYTSSLVQIVGNIEKGYNFPYLGGGITSDIAIWCATRDGVSAGWHTKSYSSGIRDPQANLKLKWRNFNQVWNNKILLGYPGDTASINNNNTFIYDFDCVKALTQIGASGACGATASFGTVSNILNFSGRGGAGLRVRGGSINTVYIDPFGPGAPGDNIQLNYPLSSISDNGVEIYNSIIKQLYAYKWQSIYVKGCTLGNVDVYPIALNVSRYTTPPTYTEQATFEIASNIDVNATLTDILNGITWSSSDYSQYLGNLNLQIGAPTVTYNGVGDTVNSTSKQSTNRQTVIVGDRIGNVPVSIPKINIYSGMVTGFSGYGSNIEPVGIFQYMPWALEFAGPATITTMFNYGGSIYSNADINPDVTVGISEIYLSDTGTLDFSKRFSGFDQWLIGGLCASNGQIYGGILFNDETGKVLGSSGVRLWNTQTKANNTINTRIPAAPPATTQPPNTTA